LRWRTNARAEAASIFRGAGLAAFHGLTGFIYGRNEMIDFIKQRKARLLTLPVQLFAATLYYFGQPELAILLLMMSLIECAAFVDAYRNGYLP
jgi:hypothetical protein